jgi:succinyl-CoA synthetase beta subunit
MDIEKVAEETPEKILKVWVDPVTGLMPYQARKLGFGLGLPESRQVRRKFVKLMLASLYKLFTEGRLLARSRSTRWSSRRRATSSPSTRRSTSTTTPSSATRSGPSSDLDEEDPVELEAKKPGLSYVASTATSAAWSTAPASRWRRWTSSSTAAASRRTSSTWAAAPPKRRSPRPSRSSCDPEVKGIFVNIFGGIMKCDVIAQGVIAAAKEARPQGALVVRLEGTNVELGEAARRERARHHAGVDHGDGAQKIVALAVKGA